MDITCVINLHRESHLSYPTIQSVKRSMAFARKAGLELELLVILDCSDEDTTAIVNRELKDFGRILVVDCGDLALSRNSAAKEARGNYVSFIDGDDLWCKSWLVESFKLAKSTKKKAVLHPEYNVYFGDGKEHVLQHVDSESERFEIEFIFKMNYWTALSFAERKTYLDNPYKRNTIVDGFGYEDWTWNYETLEKNIVHKIVPGTAHYIRRGKDEMSLLDMTNAYKAIPKILDLYRSDEHRTLRSKAA